MRVRCDNTKARDAGLEKRPVRWKIPAAYELYTLLVGIFKNQHDHLFISLEIFHTPSN